MTTATKLPLQRPPRVAFQLSTLCVSSDRQPSRLQQPKRNRENSLRLILGLPQFHRLKVGHRIGFVRETRALDFVFFLSFFFNGNGALILIPFYIYLKI